MILRKRVYNLALGLTMIALAAPQVRAQEAQEVAQEVASQEQQDSAPPPMAPPPPITAAAVPVDANDLNILFDFDTTTNRLVPNIGLSERGAQQDGAARRTRSNGILSEDHKPGQGGLLSQSIFAQVFDAGTKNAIGNAIGARLDDWRVVGLRYDSCFPKFDPVNDPQGKNCIEQVRLITQPISVKNPSGDDTTMHLLYSVRGFRHTGFKPTAPHNGTNIVVKNGVAELSPIYQQLLNLKRLAGQTNGTPMGVHPAIKARNPAFIEALTQFILTNLGPEKLMVITYMGLDAQRASAEGQPWIFFGGNVLPEMKLVKANGQGGKRIQALPGSWVIAPQPGANTGNAFASVFDNKAVVGKKLIPAPIVPRFSDEDPAPRLNTQTLGALMNAPAPAKEAPNLFPNQQANQFADFAINTTMDPVKTSPDIGDCASCHMSALRSVHKLRHVDARGTPSMAQFPFNMASVKGMPFATQLNLQHDGITAFVELANLPQVKGTWNTRNFGYFKGVATVAEITALSARTVVAHANEEASKVTRTRLANPGVQCRGNWAKMNDCLQFEEGTLAACRAKIRECQ